jgi:hypothetical protein
LFVYPLVLEVLAISEDLGLLGKRDPDFRIPILFSVYERVLTVKIERNMQQILPVRART